MIEKQVAIDCKRLSQKKSKTLADTMNYILHQIIVKLHVDLALEPRKSKRSKKLHIKQKLGLTVTLELSKLVAVP